MKVVHQKELSETPHPCGVALSLLGLPSETGGDRVAFKPDIKMITVRRSSHVPASTIRQETRQSQPAPPTQGPRTPPARSGADSTGRGGPGACPPRPGPPR